MLWSTNLDVICKKLHIKPRNLTIERSKLRLKIPFLWTSLRQWHKDNLKNSDMLWVAAKSNTQVSLQPRIFQAFTWLLLKLLPCLSKWIWPCICGNYFVLNKSYVKDMLMQATQIFSVPDRFYMYRKRLPQNNFTEYANFVFIKWTTCRKLLQKKN